MEKTIVLSMLVTSFSSARHLYVSRRVDPKADGEVSMRRVRQWCLVSDSWVQERDCLVRATLELELAAFNWLPKQDLEAIKEWFDG
jgi:hypothetical protein